MLEKKLQLIITFNKTTDSMKFEEYCKSNNLSGRIIPIPTQISAGCGLCWKTDINEKDNMILALKNSNIENYKFYEIVI